MQQTTNTQTCPVWVGRLMVSPLRKLYQNPQKILGGFISPDMKILELGPAMGFFSLPLAKLTGVNGKVYGVDLQPLMLERLKERAKRAGVLGQIETRQCSQSSFMVTDLSNEIDFALLFAMVHEVPDQNKLFAEVSLTLKKGGKVLFAEPKGHVKLNDFETSINIAQKFNLQDKGRTKIRGAYSVVLEKG